MFESAEIGHKIDKETYKKAVPELRAALLDAQFDLKENGKIPVIVLVSGQDGAGKALGHERHAIHVVVELGRSLDKIITDYRAKLFRFLA